MKTQEEYSSPTTEKMKKLASQGREELGKVYDKMVTPQPGNFGPEGSQEFPGSAIFRKLARMVVPDPRSNFEVGAAVLPYLGKMAPLLGFSKAEAIKKTLDSLKQHPELRDQLEDLFKVIKATPERAISHIKEFNLEPGLFTGGSYSPSKMNLFPVSETRTDWLTDLAGTFPHEAGHGATVPMIEKMLVKKFPKIPSLSGEQLLDWAYDAEKPAFEGTAEYLSHHIQQKAGLKPLNVFGYGPEQEKVYQELMSMPSGNPYLNAYRYLKKVFGGVKK